MPPIIRCVCCSAGFCLFGAVCFSHADHEHEGMGIRGVGSGQDLRGGFRRVFVISTHAETHKRAVLIQASIRNLDPRLDLPTHGVWSPIMKCGPCSVRACVFF